MAETAPPEIAWPVFVARRQDQLGGRLAAMTNAAAGAAALGGSFRFSWPQARETYLKDPCDIFTEEFVAKHKLVPEELEVDGVAWLHVTPSQPLDALRPHLEVHPKKVIVVDEVFEVVGWEDEQVTDRRRFQATFEGLGWNSESRRIFDARHAWSRTIPRGAVHVRAGDIIDGDWSLFLPHAKYSPTPLVHESIRQLSAGGSVLLVSDNDDYQAWLQAAFPEVKVARDLVDGYDSLSQIRRVLADMVLLSTCPRVIAPPSSAFSAFAALVGGSELVRIDQIRGERVLRERMTRGIEWSLTLAGESPLWAKLAPRDVTWHLDVFGHELPAAERWRLAKEAVRLDPGFVGALNRYARVCAERRMWRRAARAADAAIEISEAAPHRDDPLFESLATRLLVECLQAIQRRRPVNAQLVSELLARTENLVTHMTPKERVLHLLKALISASAIPVRRAPVAAPSGMLSPLRAHRLAGHYDPLTPEFERLARQLGVTAERGFDEMLADMARWGRARRRRIGARRSGT